MFSSERGNLLRLKQATLESALLEQKTIYQSDIYQLDIGSDTVSRITFSKDWNEHQPQQIQDGTIVFQSDQNGIQNLYQMILQPMNGRFLPIYRQGFTIFYQC